MPRLNAKSLKVTCVLNADEVAVIPDVGSPRVLLHIAVPEIGVVTTDIAAKSVRKVQAQIAEHGADAIAVIVQGKLVSGGKIVDAGLVAQIKAPKPAAAEAA